MATIVTDEIKQELMSRGIWGDFVRLRTDITAKDGIKGYGASRAAMEKLAPDLYEKVRKVGRPAGSTKKAIEAESAPRYVMRGVVNANDSSSSGFDNNDENTRAVCKRDVTEVKNATVTRTLGDIESKAKVKPGVFMGKSCSESVAIDWAFVRSQMGSADAKDAPSEKAWAYYMLFTKSPSAMVEIVKANAVKRVTKEDYTDGGDRFDGEAEYDLLKAIAEAGG